MLLPAHAILLVLLAFPLVALAARVEEARPLMGTIVEITAEATDAAALRATVAAAYDEMTRLSNMMSHYDPRSVVSAISDAAGVRAVRAPPELMEVLAMALRMSKRTGGAFDATVGALRGWRFGTDGHRRATPDEVAEQRPKVDYRKLVLDVKRQTAYLTEPGMRLDLGGIAKLPIVHAGMRVLAQGGIERATVNAGGDVEVRAPWNTPPWRVGVRDPRAPDRLLGVIELHRGFVVSSGDYERHFTRDGRRYHHILDPRTGEPATGPIGVSLVAADLAAVNGLAVAVMVLGKQAGIRLVRSVPGVAGMIVGRDGTVWLSPEFRARLQPVR